MTSLYDPEQVQRLIDTADRLSSELESHKLQLKITDTRSKNARLAAIFAALATTVGCIVAVVGIAYGRGAQNTADQVKELQALQQADSTEARQSSCIQFNVQRAEVRLAVKSSLLALAQPGVALTDAQQTVINRYNAVVDNQLPYRDCSPEGIVAYFKNPPADPALPK